MQTQIKTCIALISMNAFLIGGCAASRPLTAWQQRLTDYTVKEGDGDLNILRESAELRSSSSLRPAQIRFDHDDMAAPGLAPFVDRRDAHGVMVGQHPVDGIPVFFFLVGIVERPFSGRAYEIEDVRLVSCTVRDGKHQWRISDPSPEALHQYLALSWADSTRRSDPHPTRRTFPLIDDDFRFEVRDGYAHATDTRSGAEWRLSLN